MDSSTTERILVILLGLVFISSIAALVYQLLTISARDNTVPYSFAIEPIVVATDSLESTDFALSSHLPSQLLHNFAASGL
ncbi:MAG: hypothetical protein IGS54_20400 [Elainella sp. C42_A2020_010]|nr:hypothetical protein [Elainella sp. C42_A2020_010]